ncbi:MAG: hypothetical protein R3267_07785 [Paenisporosarcina sp.]|nr:hypothetical protein [Paenisporosarcina sp.]
MKPKFLHGLQHRWNVYLWRKQVTTKSNLIAKELGIEVDSYLFKLIMNDVANGRETSIELNELLS